MNEESERLNLELEWLKAHRHQYPGKWVALYGETLLALGDDGYETYKKACESGIHGFLITHIDPEDQLPFGGW